MDLQQRIDLLAELGRYMRSDGEEWLRAKRKAATENGWFTPEYIDLAVENIATAFLQPEKLREWAFAYKIPPRLSAVKNAGLVMAGNIPLVGFHDFLCVFISGHRQTIKPSSKDESLIRCLVARMIEQEPAVAPYISFAERLNGCDAYIATGSNNSARYFEYYFSRFPHIIRRNRTSVAILEGTETPEELDRLADDVCLYFGLGCRNVTKIYTPAGYDFLPLLAALKKYASQADLLKYKNNYDYQLTILILNKKYYMSTESLLLTENASFFSPISVLHLEYYPSGENIAATLRNHEEIQCIVGHGATPFGQAQQPELTDYADGIDTLQFLLGL